MAVVYLRFDVNENYFKFLVKKKKSISLSQTLSSAKEQSLPWPLPCRLRCCLLTCRRLCGRGYLFDLLTSKCACHPHTDTVALQGQTCSLLVSKTRSVRNSWEQWVRGQLCSSHS